MLVPRRRFIVVLLAVFVLGCDARGNVDRPGPPTASTSAVASPDIPPTATQTPPPTPPPIRRDIQATRLTISRLNIDAPVLTSRVTPYVYSPPPGCPPRPQDTSTVTVPNQGIATPVENFEGLENKAWIYGHSRWLGSPGTFFALQDINVGDELLIDGTERNTSERVERQRFIVDGLYLADMDSGATLINAAGPEDIPTKPLVILQTSVREEGAGKTWIFDRSKLLAKSKNLVEGNLDDPCRYLLFFVFASAS